MYWIGTIILVAILITGVFIINFLSESLYQKNEKPPSNNVKLIFNKWKTGTLIMCVLEIALIFLYHMYWPHEVLIYTVPTVWIFFIWSVFITISSYFNPTYILPPERKTGEFRTAVVIPVYNEDRELFRQVLASLTEQTHQADIVCVVEDGSLEENICKDIFDKWAVSYPKTADYYYIENSGKREAQAVAFRKYMADVDIFITIDSDTILNERALEEGIYPFFDERVMSVGGALLDYNNRDNLLTRIVGVSFVAAFSNGRSACSRWKGVMVNHGCLAFYRKEIIADNLDHYLNQIVFGQKARFGDDRMLTHYASLRGQSVYHESSYGYTFNPVKFSHLARQRTRWWRSYWWGGMWFLKHQSPRKSAWWFQLMNFLCSLMYIPIFFYICIYHPIMTSTIPWVVLLYMIVLGYSKNFRVLIFERSDMTKFQQVLNYIVFSPLASILNIFLCPILQYFALATVWKVSSWGTRMDVEVGLKAEEAEEVGYTQAIVVRAVEK